MAAEVVIHANHIMQPARKRGFRSQAVIHSQHLHAAFVRELYRNGIVGIAVSGYITSTVQVKNDRGVCMNARGRDPMSLYPRHNGSFQCIVHVYFFTQSLYMMVDGVSKIGQEIGMGKTFSPFVSFWIIFFLWMIYPFRL